MKFVFFHLMPWDEFPHEDQDWPVGNREFNPERGTGYYETYIDAMVFAEECGFDAVGCNEHHFSPYGLMTNCNLIGAALTQRTSKIKLAMTGNLVPLLNPIRVAEEYAMLDVMSGGRLIAGFMRGIPHEYVAYNMAPDESRERLAEATELIIKAWTEPEPFGWEGKYYKFPAVSIWPRPRQQPHPPIIISASNEDSARFAAKYKAMMGTVFLPSLGYARQMIDAYLQAAEGFGWTPTPEQILIAMSTCIADTDEEARRLLGRGQEYFSKVLMGGPRTAQKLVVQKTRFFASEEVSEKFVGRIKGLRTRTIEEAIDEGIVLCGTPDTVVKQIKRAQGELGMGWLNMNMKVGNMPNSAILKTMELFRDHVLPEVRHLGDAPSDRAVAGAAAE